MDLIPLNALSPAGAILSFSLEEDDAERMKHISPSCQPSKSNRNSRDNGDKPLHAQSLL